MMSIRFAYPAKVCQIVCLSIGACLSPLLTAWFQESVGNLSAQNAASVSPSTEDPKEVVRLIIKGIEEGNREQVLGLLTAEARSELERTGLEIAPFVSSKATLQVNDAVQQDDAMLVNCEWREPSADGTGVAVIKVVWDLRKVGESWRVCGMAVEPSNDSEVQVFDFENTGIPNKHLRLAIQERGQVENSKGATPTLQESAKVNQQSPMDVVKLFFEGIKEGGGAKAWEQLSTRARIELNRTVGDNNLLKAIESRTGKSIGIGVLKVEEHVPEYRSGSFFVKSTWTIFDPAGQPSIVSGVAWKLRWESRGWRIYGFVCDPEKIGEEKQFWDFEKPVDDKRTITGENSAPNTKAPVPPGYSLPSHRSPIYSSGALSLQDFELDAEIVSRIDSIASTSSDKSSVRSFRVSSNRVIDVKLIEHTGSGLETYSQIQSVLSQAVQIYQTEKEEGARAEIQASCTKLASILFQLQQLKRKAEIVGIEKRVGKLKEIVAAREKMSEQIVTSRVNQLLGISDGMGWDDLPSHNYYALPGGTTMNLPPGTVLPVFNR